MQGSRMTSNGSWNTLKEIKASLNSERFKWLKYHSEPYEDSSTWLTNTLKSTEEHVRTIKISAGGARATLRTLTDK